MRSVRRLATFGLILVAVGCSKKEPADGDGGAAGSASSTGAKGGKGLSAASNDAAIVAAAKNTLACTWKGDSLYFDTDCPAWKTWTQTADIFKVPAADATFVNFLEDTDVKVRLLGAYHLGVDSERNWVTDKGLTDRVIATAAAETVPHWEIDEHGKALGRIRYDKTGNWAQAKAAIEGTALKTLRRWAVENLPHYNETNAEVWEYVKGKVKDSDKDVAYAAITGFKWLETRKPDACKIFADAITDDRIAAYAASALAQQNYECNSSLDLVLDQADGHNKASTIKDSDWCYALQYLSKNIKASDAQKKRAIKLLGDILDNKHIEGSARASALRNLYEADHAKGKAAAKKYAADKDTSIASAAKDVTAKPS